MNETTDLMDTATLLKKAMDSRCVWEKQGGLEFQLRRPNDIDLIKCRVGVDSDTELTLNVVLACVVGWKGVTIGHIVDNLEDTAEAPFSKEALDLFLQDRPKLAASIGTALYKMLAEYKAKGRATKKASPTS